MKIIQKTLKEDNYHSVLKLDKLEIGVHVPFDIFVKKENDFVIILEEGTLLTQKMYNFLQKQSTLYVLEKEACKTKLNCHNIFSFVKNNHELYRRVLEAIYEVNSKHFASFLSDKENNFNLACIERVIEAIIFLLHQEKHYIKETMKFFKNEYSVDVHSLHVALYAVNLGMLLKLRDDEIKTLGISALLHDIGISSIDEEILRKKAKLDLVEQRIIHQHPKDGITILRHNKVRDPYVLDAVLHHHERYDGSGYPDRLKENKINKFASIVAICDVFDAMTTNRPYREKFTSFDALKFLLKDPSTRGKFNDHYLRVFLLSLQ